MPRVSAESEIAFDGARLLADAQSNTGLTDFGEEPFREPLSVLLRSLREEAQLNELGRATFRGRIVESLETRLKTQDWISRHPEILDEKIEAPIVIIGLMRTGTTMLHRILASDPRSHAAMWWEARFPAPHRDTNWGEPDPRIAHAEAEVAAILAAMNCSWPWPSCRRAIPRASSCPRRPPLHWIFLARALPSEPRNP